MSEPTDNPTPLKLPTSGELAAQRSSHANRIADFVSGRPPANGNGAETGAAPAPDTKPAEAAPAKPARPAALAAITRPDAKPPEEKKPEPDWAEAIEAKGATSDHWKKLKGERDELRRVRAELEGKFGTTDAELKKIRDEHAALAAREKEWTEKEKTYAEGMKRLEILDFERHPKFRELYETPLATARGEMEQAFKLSKVEQSLDALLALPVEKRIESANEVMAKMPPLTQSMFKDAFFDHLRHERARAEAVAKSSEVRKEFDRQQTLERHQQKQYDRAKFDSEYAKVIGEAARPIEIAADASEADKAYATRYNAELPKLRDEAAKFLFEPMDEQQTMHVALRAAYGRLVVDTVVPELGRLLEGAYAERDALKAQLEAIDRARPGYSDVAAGGGGGAPTRVPTVQQLQAGRAKLADSLSNLVRGS